MENSISTKQILNGKISCEGPRLNGFYAMAMFVLISGLHIDTKWDDRKLSGNFPDVTQFM